jgi:hypothetical protein
MARILHAEVKSGERLLATDITDLTFFPKGTILIFSTEAWNATSPEFKNIWKICNAENHTVNPQVPDLTNKFLRGAESSNFTTPGGADSQSISLTTANLPEHSHAVTALTLPSLSISGLSIDTSGGHTHSGSGSTNSGSGGHAHTGSGSTGSDSGGHTHTVSGSTSEAGSHSHGVGSRGSSTLAEAGSKIGAEFLGGATYSAYKTDTVKDHSHSVSISTGENGGAHSHDVSVSISESGAHAHDVTVSIPESGSHTHTISGGTVTASGDASGSTANAGSANAQISVNTVPVYYTVIYIIKAA